MSRLYILVIPRNSVWFLLAALGIVVLLSMYHHYPFGLYALSLVHQEVIYDIMLIQATAALIQVRGSRGHL